MSVAVIASLNPNTNVNFSEDDITLLKRNFIHGNNGSGKSTVARQLAENLDKSHEVRVFDGIESVLDENRSLRALALGSENVEASKEIDRLDNEIKNDRKKIAPTSELWREYDKLQKSYRYAEEKLNGAYTRVAKIIKEKDSPRLAPTSYNRDSLKKELDKRHPIPNEEAENLRKTAVSKRLEDLPPLTAPTTDFDDLRERAMALLSKSVARDVLLDEIGDNPDKKAFAKRGCEIHSRVSGEICAFCGNAIPLDRWEKLDNAFSESIGEFSEELERLISEIHKEQEGIREPVLPDSSFSYPKFHGTLKDSLRAIKENYNQADRFLADLERLLQQRKRDLFRPITSFIAEAPSFEHSIAAYEDLRKQNRAFGEELKEQKRLAREKLRLNLISELYESHKLADLAQSYGSAKLTFEKVESQLKYVEREIQAKEQAIESTMLKLKDEATLAKRINTILRSSGDIPFELVRESTGRKGLYKIKDRTTNVVRDIDQISTGEKNIVAFLYFVESLQAPTSSAKPKAIIFDDPMNSNDLKYQYLMISAIQRLGSNLNADEILCVLTHNTSFFLNVIPWGSNTRKLKDESITVYHLIREESRTRIEQIKTRADNYLTAYAALWADFKFAYDAKRPNLMWNCARRIFTSYCQFQNQKPLDVLSNGGIYERGVLGLAFKKAYDTNSHELLDFEAESNGATVDEIGRFFIDVFSSINALDHLNSYWDHNLPD